MIPKEHGAYGQLAFPLATALIVSGLSPAGLLVGVTAVSAFLAHEPAAILIGARGIRARRDRGRSAWRWLAVWGTVAVVAGVAALMTMPAHARPWLALPLPAAIVLATAQARGREKSWYGEVAAASAFSAVAVPVALAGGTMLPGALAVAIPFAALFIGSTLAVRIVILRVRGGGNPSAVAATRAATFGFAAASAIVIALAVASRLLPPGALIASAPGLVAAALLAAAPPSPARLRSIGWTLVAISAGTAGLVIGLNG